MAKPWSEIAASEAYRGLAADEQDVVKRQYFAAVVAPQVPEAERGAAWEQFRTWPPPASGEGSRVPQAQGVNLGEGLAREAVQGATFEFGDEIGLGGAALAAKVAQKLGAAPDTGQSVGDIYRDMREHYDDEREQFSEEHPVAATVANIAGGVGTGGAVGARLVGRAAQAGRVATTAALAGAGAAEGALSGAGAAEPDRRLEGAAEGAAVGAVAAPVAGAVAGAASRALAQRSAEHGIEKLAPTRDELTNAARVFYRKADDLGVTLKPSKVGEVQGQLLTLAKQEGFNRHIHPKVAAALDSFNDLATDVPTLARLEQQRRILGAAAKSLEPDERRVAGKLIDQFDDAIETMTPADVSAGDASQASELLGEARGLWRRQAKLGLIEDAVERAKNQASGFENGLRVQFRSILDNPKLMRGFSDDEREAMQYIVRGGVSENMMRLVGKLGWGDRGSTNVVGAAIGAGAGLASGGGLGAVAVPIAGQVARRTAERATVRNMERLHRMAAVGAGLWPRHLVNEYAKAAGQQATPEELSRLFISASRKDLLKLATELNALKGPNRKLANDALILALTGRAGAAAGEGEEQPELATSAP